MDVPKIYQIYTWILKNIHSTNNAMQLYTCTRLINNFEKQLKIHKQYDRYDFLINDLRITHHFEFDKFNEK